LAILLVGGGIALMIFLTQQRAGDAEEKQLAAEREQLRQEKSAFEFSKLMAQAQDAMDEQHFDEAASVFTEALKLNPNDPEAAAGLANARNPDYPALMASQAEGVEVLARGPVHEAYMEPVTTQPQPSPVVSEPPPEPIEEVPPDQKPDGDNCQWIPGYWAWDDEPAGYIWVSGFWRVAPSGRRWMPGHWQEIDKGWQWVAGFWAPADAEEIVYVPYPPDPQDDEPTTPAPDEDSTYIPGYWIHVEGGFAFKPGYWVHHRKHWVWIPAHYIWTPIGCIFVNEYWDRSLDECGLPFAPIRIDPPLLKEGKFRHVPRFVVHLDFLIGALFVREANLHYYFGDYFEDNYAKKGYVPWVDGKWVKGGIDPYFAYIRTEHKGEPSWEAGLRELYKGRQDGRVQRPPRTLIEQVQAVKKNAAGKTSNVAVHQDIHITHRQNVTALAPVQGIHNTKVTHLSSLSQGKEAKPAERVVKIAPVPKEQQTREQQAAGQLKQAGQQRHSAEDRVLNQGGGPVKHTDPPQTVRVERPPAQSQPEAQAPPAPQPPPAAPPPHARPVPEYHPPAPPQPARKK
jgi:hypothetical protein